MRCTSRPGAIKLEVVTGPEGADETVQQSTLKYRVPRFGVTSDFKAGLIFVKRLGDGASEDLSVNFDPVPSLRWTLHYTARNAAVWNAVGLGLGLGAIGLYFPDDGPQVGTGLGLGLFHDIVYGGFGWNLQVDEDREYGYLELGVLEMAQAVV